MKNNELLKKVEKVGYGIFAFFFWYLVIGFFLKSDYPIYEQSFNRSAAYELLRDSLTLSAYFLAPAMAVVLFSDWREEHASVKNEKISLEVKNLLSNAISSLETWIRNYSHSDAANEDIRLYFRDMRLLNKSQDDITIFNDCSKEYVDKLDKINDLIFKSGVLWELHYGLVISGGRDGNPLGIANQINEIIRELKKLNTDLKPLLVLPK